jgi:hypothetical protein
MCSKGIAKTFENPKYVKLFSKGIASCALGVFSTMGYCKTNTLNAFVFMISNN